MPGMYSQDRAKATDCVKNSTAMATTTSTVGPIKLYASIAATKMLIISWMYDLQAVDKLASMGVEIAQIFLQTLNSSKSSNPFSALVLSAVTAQDKGTVHQLSNMDS